MCHCVALPGVEASFCMSIRVKWLAAPISKLPSMSSNMPPPKLSCTFTLKESGVWEEAIWAPCFLQNSKAELPWEGNKSFFFSSMAGNFAAFNHTAHLTSLPFQTVQTNCSTKAAIGREYSEAALGCSVVIGHITHMVSFPFWWEEGRNLLHADT